MRITALFAALVLALPAIGAPVIVGERQTNYEIEDEINHHFQWCTNGWDMQRVRQCASECDDYATRAAANRKQYGSSDKGSGRPFKRDYSVNSDKLASLRQVCRQIHARFHLLNEAARKIQSEYLACISRFFPL